MAILVHTGSYICLFHSNSVREKSQSQIYGQWNRGNSETMDASLECSDTVAMHVDRRLIWDQRNLLKIRFNSTVTKKGNKLINEESGNS